MNCFQCDRDLDAFDVGAYRKLVDKCAPRYLCRECLCRELSWTRAYLDRQIVRWQEQGCLLFPPLKNEKEKEP